MTHKQTVLSLGIAFVLGCVAAPVANQLAIRPAQAAPEGVRKWEQYCSYQRAQLVGWDKLYGALTSTINADLKARGLEGWELASTTPIAGGGTIDGLIYCMRRPIP
jgi:hypothetical protein